MFICLFVEATEKRMLLGSPLVGENLVQVPSQNAPENNVQHETDDRSVYCVIVENFVESDCLFDRFDVNHFSERQNESNVRNYRNSGENISSSIFVACHRIIKDVLNDEEKQTKNNPNFCSGKEYLHKETLNN